MIGELSMPQNKTQEETVPTITLSNSYCPNYCIECSENEFAKKIEIYLFSIHLAKLI